MRRLNSKKNQSSLKALPNNQKLTRQWSTKNNSNPSLLIIIKKKLHQMPNQANQVSLRNHLQGVEVFRRRARIVVGLVKVTVIIATVMTRSIVNSIMILTPKRPNGLRSIRNKRWPNSTMYCRGSRKFKTSQFKRPKNWRGKPNRRHRRACQECWVQMCISLRIKKKG